MTYKPITVFWVVTPCNVVVGYNVLEVLEDGGSPDL
jgi:hypothetical protein